MGRLFHCSAVRGVLGLLGWAALLTPAGAQSSGSSRNPQGRPLGTVGQGRPFGNVGHDRPFGSFSRRPFGDVGHDRPFGSLSDRPFGSLSDRPFGDLGHDRPFAPLGGLSPESTLPLEPPDGLPRPPDNLPRPLIVWDFERAYPPELPEPVPVGVPIHALERPFSPAPVSVADWFLLPPERQRQALALATEARAALRRGDYGQAETLGRRAHEEGGVGGASRGLALFALGRYEAAAPLLLAAGEAPPFHPEAEFASPREFECRLAELAEFLSGSPADVGALLTEGALSIAMGRAEVALLDLTTLEQVVPGDLLVAQLRERVVAVLGAGPR